MRAALAALLLLIAPAAQAGECKTKSEARAMFPRAHLYWVYSGDRQCWSNKKNDRPTIRQISKPHRKPLLREADPLPIVPSPPIAPKPEPDPWRDRAAPTFENLWRNRT